jgi:hypothetical protein
VFVFTGHVLATAAVARQPAHAITQDARIKKSASASRKLRVRPAQHSLHVNILVDLVL